MIIDLLLIGVSSGRLIVVDSVVTKCSGITCWQTVSMSKVKFKNVTLCCI
jgi:hypothetical protein